jgi:UDP-N-acetylmuramoylalanine--D-glutamate ligase
MNLSGKKITILGFGRSGMAAARLALREGAEVSIWDEGAVDPRNEIPAGLAAHPHFVVGSSKPPTCDCLVVSPGIDTYGPLVAAFAASAGEIIGEVELASRFYHGKIVGITGTNGKTTTTELVSRILAHSGLGGTACGNYGTAFSEVVMSAHPPAAVALELSSFQLETIRSLRPDVAVWLNFAPDHMDRYPSLEAYHAAKSRIFINLRPSDTAVVRTGENITLPPCKKIEFSTSDRDTTWFSDGRKIFHHGEACLDLEAETPLRGLHNAENMMAAMAATGALGISYSQVAESLQGYTAPAHRCEWIRSLDEVDYLNDSKATNLHALESALRSQVRPVVLIAGGKDKGLDYTPLLETLREKALAVVTFGQIAQDLAATCSAAVHSEAVQTLVDAVATARMLAPRGSTVLLSPGTSSFDQFQSYVQRGNAFRDLVHQLQ